YRQSKSKQVILQYSFINSKGAMIGMPLNGCNTNRSSSPVMIHEALPPSARARNLSSLGSRHTTNSGSVSVGSVSRSSFSKKLLIDVRERYFRSFFFFNVFSNSETVAKLIRSMPDRTALSKAWPGTDEGKIAALTNTLVSMTNRLDFFIQDFFQYLRGKAFFLCFLTQHFPCSKKGLQFSFIQDILNYLVQYAGYLLLLFNGRCLVSFSNGRVDFNFNFFHNLRVYTKYTKKQPVMSQINPVCGRLCFTMPLPI